MSKAIRPIIAALFLLAASFTIFVVRDRGQGVSAQAQSGLPQGKWTYSASPYTGAGYESSPVVVTSVGTDKTQGLSTKIVKLENRSTKPVAAVRLKWVLRNAEKPDTILQQGNTDRLTSPEGFPAGKARVLKQVIVSFSEISRPLVRQGKLEGNYLLTIGVTEVFFADGSTWKEGQTGKSFSHSPGAGGKPAPPCPKQKCFYNSGGDGSFYTCGASGDQESCTNCVSTCFNTVCGSNPPDSPDPVLP